MREASCITDADSVGHESTHTEGAATRLQKYKCKVNKGVRNEGLDGSKIRVGTKIVHADCLCQALARSDARCILCQRYEWYVQVLICVMHRDMWPDRRRHFRDTHGTSTYHTHRISGYVIVIYIYVSCYVKRACKYGMNATTTAKEVTTDGRYTRVPSNPWPPSLPDHALTTLPRSLDMNSAGLSPTFALYSHQENVMGYFMYVFSTY